MLLDTDIALRHLLAEGWEIQTLIRTRRNELSASDETGHQWRLLTYLPADTAQERHLGVQAARDSGRLLSHLHASLQKLAYMPAASVPHLHDTGYYAAQLEQRVPRLPLAELRSFAAELLTAYDELSPMPTSSPQLIHGDPRITNLLFRRERPFTFIDFDTIVQGNIWSDLGDLLRSVNGNDEQTAAKFSLERTRHIVEGYRLSRADVVPAEQFLQWALIATEHTCLELAMRFLSDIVDDTHFDWDSGHYVSRAAHNLSRSHAQWNIYQYFKWATEDVTTSHRLSAITAAA